MKTTIKERLIEYIDFKNIGQGRFEKAVGFSNGYINNVKKSFGADKLEKIFGIYTDLNREWLLTGEGEMIKITKEDEAVFLEDPNIIMIPLVSQYAYAGYLSGFSDMEYIDTLPKVPMFVDHESKGNYFAFEVRGDSMDEDSREGIFAGDRLYCREIKKDLWRYKLHINQWDFVIVHKTEGILIKRIIDHDTNTGEVTIHSLNPAYPDKVINLNDIAQLFNVIEIARGRRR